MIKQCCAVTLILSAFWAQIAAAASPAADKYAGIHAVAVVSAIGHVPILGTGPMFSWTSPPEVTFPDDWKLDDFTSSLITDALKSRFTVLRVPAEPDFAKHLNAGLFTTAFSKYRDLLKEKPLLQPVDAYVMIVAREISSGYGDWTGLQLAHMGGGLLGREQTLASAAYEVDVYDATTGSRIDFGTSRLPDAGPLSTGLISDICSGGDLSVTPDKLSETQKQQITDEFHFLIAATLPTALKNAGLVASADPISAAAARQSAEGVCRPNG